MKLFLLGAVMTTIASANATSANETDLIETVKPYVQKVVGALDSLPAERRQMLTKVADHLVDRIQSGQNAQLTFICTHNSRRSHFSQVWCQLAAEYYNVPRVYTYSGGTETTACNIRTVRALRRAGLSVVASTQNENPVYLVQFSDDKPPMRTFSKRYDQDGNPSNRFVAMMCCADADEKCPLVRGAAERFPLHYEDPKVADGTDQETARYDERCFQIATEMFFVMSRVSDKLKQ